MVEKRFGALRFVSGLFKILAWIVLVLGVLGAFGVLIGGILGGAASSTTDAFGQITGGLLGGVVGGVVGFIAILIFSLIQFVVLKATSELFIIFVAVEYNTRLTAYYASGGQQGSLEPGMVAPPPPIR